MSNRRVRHASTAGGSYRLLTPHDLNRIHQATLEVLAKTGVWVEDAEARRVFASGGADVDKATGIVRLPRDLVEQALRCAPKGFVICGRDPAKDFAFDQARVGFATYGEGLRVRDVRTGARKTPTLADFRNSVRLADALSDVDVYEKVLLPFDVPVESAPLYQGYTLMGNTTKPGFMGPRSGFLARRLVEMASLVVGGPERLRQRPIVSFIACPVSPLKLLSNCCQVIRESALAGLPVNIIAMGMAGGSSPVTLAGTLVTHNAEVLSCVTLCELTRQGAPVIYGSSTTAMDLRSAVASLGSPECGLISAAVAQLARFYLLPSWVAGGLGDAKTVDVQAGHEKTITALLPALAGANLIYGLGMIESGTTFDFGQLVVDDELARMIKFTLGGIPVNDETLAVDVIADVGSFNDFLGHEHTLRHMREQSASSLLDRRVYEEWEASGSTSLYERACEKALHILETHCPEPLPESVVADMQAIIADAEEELGVNVTAGRVARAGMIATT